MWYLQRHFVYDKLWDFCTIFFHFSIYRNNFIVSHLKFLGYNLRRAPNGARRSEKDQ